MGLASTEKSDIIEITETWVDLGNKDLSTAFEIEGYNLFNVDRQRKRKGEVAQYVKKTIECYMKEPLKTK